MCFSKLLKIYSDIMHFEVTELTKLYDVEGKWSDQRADFINGQKKNLCMQTTAELKTINPFYIAEISKFRVNKCHGTVEAAFLFQSLVKDS